MVSYDRRHARRQFFRRGNMQELVRPMGIGAGAEHSCDQELRRGNFSPGMLMNGMVPPSPICMAGVGFIMANIVAIYMRLWQVYCLL